MILHNPQTHLCITLQTKGPLKMIVAIKHGYMLGCDINPTHMVLMQFNVKNGIYIIMISRIKLWVVFTLQTYLSEQN